MISIYRVFEKQKHANFICLKDGVEEAELTKLCWKEVVVMA